MSDLLTVKEVAELLKISPDAARSLMRKTRGVIMLPAATGEGKRVTMRMPRAVLDALLVQWSKPKR